MFGPAFNLFLRKINFKLFNMFQCDRKSAPGLFMSILWCVCILIFIVFYSNKTVKSKRTESNRENKRGLLKDDETHTKSTSRLKLYKNEFLRIEIVVILLVTFFTYFNQTSLETIVIPFTESYFAWNELHNSLLFCIGGGIIIVSYIIVRFISVRWSDKVALFFGKCNIYLSRSRCLLLFIIFLCLFKAYQAYSLA